MTIREHRKAKRLTLHKLSELSGVSVTQIQAVETGKSDPGNMSARNLLVIAKALNADPYELIGENNFIVNKWIYYPNNGVYDVVCSKCGYSPGILFWSSPFCPNCGAKMDLE